MVRLFVLVCLFINGMELLAQPYQSGYFITLDHKQVKGSIKFAPILCGHLTSNGSVPGRIKVKPENESKVFELTADEIRGFVAGADSFVIMKNIPVSEREHFKRDFVKVEAQGPLDLFVHCSQIPSGRFGTKMKTVYILLRAGSRKLIAFHNRYQKDQFIKLIEDDPGLVTEVQNDWQWMDKIPQVVRKYNAHTVNINAKR
jgi:hypothetical protein